MATRGCRNPPDMFCYVCGLYIGKKKVLHNERYHIVDSVRKVFWNAHG